MGFKEGDIGFQGRRWEAGTTSAILCEDDVADGSEDEEEEQEEKEEAPAMHFEVVERRGTSRSSRRAGRLRETA